MKQTRQAIHTSNLFKNMDHVRRTLLRANDVQCGSDSAYCSLKIFQAFASMDCPYALAHDETSEASLYCTASLHRYGLPHEYAKMENLVLPETCA